MAYLVIHPIHSTRPGAHKSMTGDPIMEPRAWEPGELFEPAAGDDVEALKAAGVLADNDKDGQAKLAAAEVARQQTRSPYGLL